MKIQEKKELDKNTKQYIKGLKWIQSGMMVCMIMIFIIVAQMLVINNKEGLKEVALSEVRESMKETVNNITIHIDSIRERKSEEALASITDILQRIQKSSNVDAETILSGMEVCQENLLGSRVQAVYMSKEKEIYHITAHDRAIRKIDLPESEQLYTASVCKNIQIGEDIIILYVKQSDIDELTQKEIYQYIHSEYYEGNQYIWVNEVVNMEGGENYAIRRIHPNMVESEGEYLSTSMTDIKGNYPYEAELTGIRKSGQIFHSYYFKNKINNKIEQKYSYARYYQPFHWIIATGETIGEVYAISEEINERSIQKLMGIMLASVLIFVIIFGMMIKILEKQAKNFRKKLLKQSEIIENIYTTMDAGVLRIRMEEKKFSIIKINPMGLKLFGVESEAEFIRKSGGYMISTMEPKDAHRLRAQCEKLKEPWESYMEECQVKWKDNTLHLLRIRDTLVEIDGNTKTIQRICQDITEERRQQELALMAAEEKATFDPMTQIKNKKAIETIIRNEIAGAAEKKLPLAVGFVDIDNFRDYNTNYGHMQGDEVIKYVASTLRENIPGTVGRNGGDEFTFCIPNAARQEVEAAMQTIHKLLNKGIIVKEDEKLIPTPCSIGVVICKGSELTYDYIMEQADAVMYEVKAKGKNTYHILEVD